MNELREKAKAEIDYSGKDLENKSKELEALILETKETKDDIEVELEERENELRELRKQIKESYEELKPNFSRHNMLNKFFLGFNQNNEDVNVFKYSQEPILFCYDGKNSDKNSIISTIKMICSQVMSNMNPLSYKINLIDTVTGGNDFIAFTNSVNDTSTDEIFQLHTTKDEVSELNKHLEEEVKKRRQEILISSDNINEYNDRNVERGARPYPVEMYIYYQYNIIDIVKQEQLDNLFNSSKNLGIYLIYMVDYTQFSPTKDTSKELNTDYKYSIDEFIQTIKKFKPECMFNFKPEDSSVTIQQTTPENLVDICKKQIKPIREV